MPRKGENIYKRKDGRWEGRYIRTRDANNKVQYGYVYGKSYKAVKQELVNRQVLCRQPLLEETTSNILYGNLLDKWLSSSKHNTKESTYARYSHLIRTHIKPNLGNYPMGELTAQRIEDFIGQQLTGGRLDNTGGLAAKTVIDMLVIIKNTLEYAQYMGIDISCKISRLTVKKHEKEMRVLTFDEQKQLVSLCSSLVRISQARKIFLHSRNGRMRTFTKKKNSTIGKPTTSFQPTPFPMRLSPLLPLMSLWSGSVNGMKTAKRHPIWSSSLKTS